MARLGLVAMVLSLCLAVPAAAAAEAVTPPPYSVAEHYTKYEYRITMRDGTALFTAVYVPKDQSKTYPFLLVRTPYSSGAHQGEARKYGVDYYPKQLGPAPEFDQAGYIFVFQDVRGRYMSGDKWVEMRPHIDDKKSKADVDDSSDTYDTVDWLVKNIPGNNGKAGLWGISYPGFYAEAGMIDTHPAIKAASPQAPVTNLYRDDDAYHGGAYMLAANFDFYGGFKPQDNPTDQPETWDDFRYGTHDGYQFFLDHPTLTSLDAFFTPESGVNWHEMIDHPTYDSYWQSRDIAPHLKNIKPAVLLVGGWFDAEDLQGPLTSYHMIGKLNPGNAANRIVMGPWVHGGWERRDGRRLGHVDFAADTAEYYRRNIVFPFFEQYLKDQPDAKLAKATMFETGTNVWRRYAEWPPVQAQPRMLYLLPGGGLGWAPPKADAGYDDYVSDPAKPVPYLGYPATGVPKEYMVADQRFAATRPDVLVYQTAPLEYDVTIAGPIAAKLFVSSTGTDGDWVVKLIDVYPANLELAADKKDEPASADVPAPEFDLAGFQQLIRGGPFRAKYRNSFEHPEPLVPGQVTRLGFELSDINHCFRRGHRIMIQVQSSWFPLADRNPQVFMNIREAKAEDFKPARQRVYHSATAASGLEMLVMPGVAQ